MIKAYRVYLSVAYEPDIEFGTFINEADANSYRDELINAADMSHYRDIEVGPCHIWESIKEMKDKYAADLAEWQRINPEI